MMERGIRRCGGKRRGICEEKGEVKKERWVDRKRFLIPGFPNNGDEGQRKNQTEMGKKKMSSILNQFLLSLVLVFKNQNIWFLTIEWFRVLGLIEYYVVLHI